jgi:diphthamide synthase subunit DPH2
MRLTGVTRMITAPITTTVRTYYENYDGLREKLRRMVDGIAEDVVQGRMRFFPDDESVVDDMNGQTFYEVYNTKYIIGDDGSFHDVMLMLAGGGPVIWLDTWSQEIRGSWGSDKYTKYIYDYDYVLDYWEEEYGCLS